MSFAPVGRKIGEDASFASQTSVEMTENPSHRVTAVFQEEEDAATPPSNSNKREDIPSTHDSDLTMIQAATLLTADCLGTGLLALPQDIQVLGTIVGLTFLVCNLPIAWYAGSILSHTASRVEGKRLTDKEKEDKEIPNTGDGLVRGTTSKNTNAYSSVAKTQQDTAATRDDDSSQQDNVDDAEGTHDYIGMTREVFHHPWATHMVTAVFYVNTFLVLSDYILVMAHAVKAFVGDDYIYLPTAGLLASTLMFGLSQFRTMSQLGHSVTFLSLACLAVVVVQCIVAAERNEPEPGTYTPPSQTSVLRKFLALASIGFATGSNKLLLQNIRKEMKHREESPKSLRISLSVFGSVYVLICVLAGPTFLFDSISGPGRRVAGLLFWIHVAVSYAINSQAMCSSLDRIFFRRTTRFGLDQKPERRWLLLTLVFAVSSYMVANAVPFFKDLVALIGALTAVPLSIIFPALLFRRSLDMPVWCPTRHSLPSYALLVFGLVFLVIGLTGALGSIELDWANQGSAFACSV